MKNADKIRALPNETLAVILYSSCINFACDDCPIAPLCDGIFRMVDEWFDWLGSEAEE